MERYQLAPFGIALKNVVGYYSNSIYPDKLNELRSRGFRPEVLLEADIYELDHDEYAKEEFYLAAGGRHILLAAMPDMLEPGEVYAREDLLLMMDYETGVPAFTPDDIDTAVNIGILSLL